MQEKQIFEILKKVREKALAIYSDFKVGALIITPEGKFYTGNNIESSSYGLTICAERVALFKALSEGERKFEKIYIISPNEDFCPPCGACRQLLMDYTPEIEVVMVSDRFEKKTLSIKCLLPDSFSKNNLLKHP